MAAEAVLKKVQEHPDAWTRVDAILEHSKNPQTKFFGLQVRQQEHPGEGGRDQPAGWKGAAGSDVAVAGSGGGSWGSSRWSCTGAEQAQTPRH